MIAAFDTSNYTTSLALITDAGDVLADERILLSVKEGERGLRQSDALFQHGKNLPLLMKRAFASETERQVSSIKAIACSTRPRAVDGSYMPCFLAGQQLAESLAALLSVPLYAFSHQEGHMAAASYGTSLAEAQDFLAWHLSGGTCELLQWHWGRQGEPSRETLLAHSLDISFGQVLDRTGVAMGVPFPCGRTLDQWADAYAPSSKGLRLSKPPRKGPDFNLSGLETQLLNLQGKLSKEQLAFEAFTRIGETLASVTKDAAEQTGIRQVLFAGGVSSSRFIRRYLEGVFADDDASVHPVFGSSAYAPDNAVGIGLLGARAHTEKEVRGWH